MTHHLTLLSRRRVWHLAGLSALWVVAALAPHPSWAQPAALVMASTTSTEQSGLFGHLLPAFRQATGIEVKVVALGTGQALDMGRRGDADVLFVHDQAAEEKLVVDGFGLRRYPVMYNDFVLVGPRADPAGTRGKDIVAALRQLAKAQAPFVSRGDNSGTHAAELRYWKLASVDDKGAGYKACGCGMGPALNMAASTQAYALTDRGTWLSFKNRDGLSVLVEGILKYDPFSRNLFCFVNKRRNQIKVLYWQRTGFCLWLKRLEEEKVKWPFHFEPLASDVARPPTVELSEEQLLRLLDGLDLRHLKPHRA